MKLDTVAHCDSGSTDLRSGLRRIRRMKTLLALTFAVLAAAPAAVAGGVRSTQPSAVPAWHRRTASSTTSPFAAAPGRTTLVTVAADGSVWNWPSFRGSLGIPMIGYQTPVGISRDGRRLFLQSLSVNAPTDFLVVDLRSMRAVDRFTLRGAFSFDALSPDGSKLYLTDRVDPSTTRPLPGRSAATTSDPSGRECVERERTTEREAVDSAHRSEVDDEEVRRRVDREALEEKQPAAVA